MPSMGWPWMGYPQMAGNADFLSAGAGRFLQGAGLGLLNQGLGGANMGSQGLLMPWDYQVPRPAYSWTTPMPPTTASQMGQVSNPAALLAFRRNGPAGPGRNRSPNSRNDRSSVPGPHR